MTLFILVDSLSPAFKKQYAAPLKEIHSCLRKKLQAFGDVLVVQASDYPGASAFYKSLPSQSKGRDVCILDAFAGALCTGDLKNFLSYQAQHRYEVLFPETLPEGLLPSLIAADFLEDLCHFVPENTPLSSSFKSLINWEYKGVDVGIWLSPSKIALKRIPFLPEDKGSVLLLQALSSQNLLSIADLENFLNRHPELACPAPRYCAIEPVNSKGFIFLEDFRSLIASLDAFAPEAVLSLGIHNEVFSHPQFSDILAACGSERHILVESPSLTLDEALVQKALARPNTEVIFNYSPAIKGFLQKFPQNEHLWVRLARDKDTEPFIRSFLNDFSFLGERAIVAKADSFGSLSRRSVDLAPIKRHICYCLQREMLFTAQGGLMFCRQAPDTLQGSALLQTLEELWALRQKACLKEPEAACPLCPSCDDWWIFNF